MQGNQPDQQAAYLYAWSGQPWKTQALVRRILDELYGSDASGWLFRNATPVAYRVSPLNALGNEPVIETLELSVQSFVATGR